MDSRADPSYSLDIADDTFLVAAPEDVAAVVADPAAWALWWPDLRLVVTRDRGLAGQQWSVTGSLRGSMEIWLEPWGDGVILHWYLRAERRGPRRRTTRALRRTTRERARRGRRWKEHVHALKDRLEEGREPGMPRAGADGGAVKDPRGPAEAP